MKRVYISATYNDLREHRSAVAHALRKMNYEVRCMEDYVATDERTDERCKDDVARCDFYVGIIALRYGWIPPGSSQSITEQEYLRARSQPDKTRCLMFLLDETAAWPQQFIDALRDPEAAAKLKAFRSRLNGYSVSTFNTLESLVQEVMATVYMEDLKAWKMSLKQEFEKLLNECRVKPAGEVGDLGSNFYKLILGGSYTEDIVKAVQTAIRNVDKSKLVKVDLGQLGGWWSTRLHLLAGLLADYTKVEKLVFFAGRRCLGTCGPAQVRRALAEITPKVEKAFAASLLGHHAGDPTQDIPKIVVQFSQELDTLGGEEYMKANHADFLEVQEHIVRGFKGFSEIRLQSRPDQDEMELLADILSKKDLPFIPLEEAGDTVIIDRVRLASEIAQLAVERV